MTDAINPDHYKRLPVKAIEIIESAIEGAHEPPDGWRWLEVGEVIRKGDQGFENSLFHAIDSLIGMELQAHWRPIIRRNRFEVGEKVVHVHGVEPCEIVGFDRENDKYWITTNGSEYAYGSEWLAPYIEDAK